jgi:N12 class adenine-specific DNA methylase
MKKTAVEWLFEQYVNKSIITIEDIEQAKEMAKQQIKDASCPYIGGWEDDEFEYWYNQTFKNSEQ